MDHDYLNILKTAGLLNDVEAYISNNQFSMEGFWFSLFCPMSKLVDKANTLSL